MKPNFNFIFIFIIFFLINNSSIYSQNITITDFKEGYIDFPDDWAAAFEFKIREDGSHRATGILSISHPEGDNSFSVYFYVTSYNHDKSIYNRTHSVVGSEILIDGNWVRFSDFGNAMEKLIEWYINNEYY